MPAAIKQPVTGSLLSFGDGLFHVQPEHWLFSLFMVPADYVRCYLDY